MNINNQNIPDNNKNPWKGLNFYTEEDKDNFFGRDEEIQRLSLYVINNTQSVLYGKSGIGKSSIIQAGIFPIARAEGMLPISIRLSHDNEQTYIEQIREKFTEEENFGRLEIREIAPRINNHEESLWEYFHRHQFLVPGTETIIRPLIVFDQFEEIFTLQKNEKLKLAFFAELADLLNEVKPQYIVDAQNEATNQYEEPSKKNSKSFELDFGATDTDEQQKEYGEASNFNIIFIIREDFLAHLERYSRYIPSMKTNRFALLPLNEEQAAEIIMKPQAGLLSAEVAELIIQKVTQRQDFRIGDEPEVEVDAVVLSLYLSQLYTKRDGDGVITKEMVNDYGSTIIRNFYEGAVFDLPQNEIEILEDLLLTYDGRRNNVSVRDIMRKGVSKHVIDILTEDRKLLRLFNYQNDDRIEYMHDVLCQVVSDRVNQRELHRAQQGEKLQKRKNRVLRWGIAASVLILVAVGLYIWDGYYHDIERHYSYLIKRNGWFEGLNELSIEQASHYDTHYVLKYKGRMARHPYAMEARNGYGRLTTNHGVAPYILNQFDETDAGADSVMIEKLKTVCQWEFVPDMTKSFLLQERALDKNGNLIYSYNRSKTNHPQKVLGTYTDDFGFPIILRDSLYFYLLTTYDERGYEVLMEFYDDHGYPIPNKDGAYQTRWEYLNNGSKKAEYSCFLDGRPMIDRAGNCGWKNIKYSSDSLHVLEAISVGVDGEPRRMTSGTQIIVHRYEYDEEFRNLTKESFWQPDGSPDTCVYGYHAVCREYNDYGQEIALSLYDKDNQPCTNNFGFKGGYTTYDNYGNKTKVINLFNDSSEIVEEWAYEKDTILVKYERYSVFHKDTGSTDTIYWANEGYSRFYYDTKRNEKTYIYDDSNAKVVLLYDQNQNDTLMAYFLLDGEPIMINGFHKRITRYKYGRDTTDFVISYLNDQNQILYSYNIIEDSINHTKLIRNYDTNGNWSSSYRNIFDDNTFSHQIATESINQYNEQKRTYSNNACYYRANYFYPIKPALSNQCIGYTGDNEFNEPSIIYDGTGNGCYAVYYYKNDTLYFDESGKKIDDINSVEWPIAAFVEVYPNGAGLGFKDGDIILSCNNGETHICEDGMYMNWELLFLPKHRDFLVARYNKYDNIYDTLHIVVPESIANISQHVSFNVFRCTQKEINCFYKLMKMSQPKQVACGNPVGANSVAAHMNFPNGAILVEMKGWNMYEDIFNLPRAINENKKNHKYVVFWDNTSRSIKSFDTDEELLGIQMYDSVISPSLFDSISTYYEKWKIEYHDRL